jgi:hypothetical protein
MYSARLVLTLCVALVVAVTAPSAAARRAGDEPPKLPDGACGGAWAEPQVVGDYGEIVPRPPGDRDAYRGFHLSHMFDRAREHRRAFAEGWISNTPEAFTASFVFTAYVEARAKELRALTDFPSNVRFLPISDESSGPD